MQDTSGMRYEINQAGAEFAVLISNPSGSVGCRRGFLTAREALAWIDRIHTTQDVDRSKEPDGR
jgi:hypothetical protein